jgi:putative intracellular protease/amidase
MLSRPVRGRAPWIALGVLGASAAAGGMWLLSLPSAPAITEQRATTPAEKDAILNGLKPRRAGRPVIAIVGINDATETTDYLMPYGILKRSNVADVVLLATRPGPVKLYPALVVEPDATVAEFDAQHPGGADYVIVPAMSRNNDPAALEWIRQQAGKGATIIGVCVGATVVGESGLLDGRRATTHWFYVDELLDGHPTIQYVPDRRLVIDRGVATTTGITASMPFALTLIEAIGGRARAEAVARDLGIRDWDARHDSGAFTITRPFALTVMANRLAFWNQQTLGIELKPGLDEVSLALVADAWSRTYRSRAMTFAQTAEALVSRHGARIVPDRVASVWPGEDRLPPIGNTPAKALDEALDQIGARYGPRTAYVVAMQLEYPMSRDGVRTATRDIRPRSPR